MEYLPGDSNQPEGVGSHKSIVLTINKQIMCLYITKLLRPCPMYRLCLLKLTLATMTAILSSLIKSIRATVEWKLKLISYLFSQPITYVPVPPPEASKRPQVVTQCLCIFIRISMAHVFFFFNTISNDCPPGMKTFP